MQKKSLLPLCAALTALITSNVVQAGNFYLGPSVIYQEITAPNSTVRGIKPKFTVGYGSRFDDFNLGLEAFYIPGIATMSDNHDNGAPSVKVKQEYGASILPGYYITDSIIGYARLGAISSNFSGVNTRKTGGQAGVGFETRLTDHWDIRAEYIYTQYPNITGLGTVHSNEGDLSFIYRFSRYSCPCPSY